MKLLKRFKKIDSDKATSYLGLVGAALLLAQQYGLTKEWVGFLEAGTLLAFSYLTNKKLSEANETTNR